MLQVVSNSSFGDAYIDLNVNQLSEIYQVTGPVERFAGQIASSGYVVGAQSQRT